MAIIMSGGGLHLPKKFALDCNQAHASAASVYI